jgi:uncharacterized membrane protein
MVSNRWVVIALTASLAINVFLAGMFIGRRMVVPPPPPLGPAAQQPPAWRPGDRALPPMIDRIAEGLSPQYRSIFRSTMDKHRPDIVATGAALREARGKVREMLSAENFDRDGTAAAMAQLQERESKFRQSLQSALLDAASGLPLEGRRQMMINPPRRAPPQ